MFPLLSKQVLSKAKFYEANIPLAGLSKKAFISDGLKPVFKTVALLSICSLLAIMLLYIFGVHKYLQGFGQVDL